MKRSRLWLLAALAALVALTSCGLETVQPPGNPLPTSPALPTAVPSVDGRWWAVDALARSPDVAGVDIHLRYAERTAAGITLYLAFYNNSGSDLAFVRGGDPSAARLVGTTTVSPTARSDSLQRSIAPADPWPADAATNGTLQFPSLPDTALTLLFAGFPPLPFRLNLPLREPPEPLPVADGLVRYAFTLPATDGSATLRLLSATVLTDALHIALTATRRDAAPRQAELRVTVLDARWNPLAPLSPAETEDEPPSLRFARPVAGDVVFVRVVGFPLVRLPLADDEPPTLATSADLPPSAVPRPAVIVPTPPLVDAATAATRDTLRLLDQINAALIERDRVGYVSAFIPPLSTAQTQLFDQIGNLPLETVSFAAEPVQEVLDPETPNSYMLTVTLRYQVRDVAPSNPFVHSLRVAFERDGAWRISALTGDLPFWAYGRAAAERHEGFWFFFRPEFRGELTAIIAETLRAAEQVNRMLPGRLPPTNVVFVTGTATEFGVLSGRSSVQFAGAAVSRYIVDDTGVHITNQAFLLNSAAFRATVQTNREQVITHELTHLALASTTMPFAPAWLVEGMAMVVSNDLPALQRSQMGDISLDALTGLTIFGHDSDDEQTLRNYGYAALLTSYLLQTYGNERVLRLYDAYAATPPATVQAVLADVPPDERFAALGLLAQELTPTYIEQTSGIALPALEADFDAWLETQAQ